MNPVSLVAFDLDGTLTQHKSPLDEKNRELLRRLSEKYTLLMVGAGECIRIFNQMGHFPLDIIGNYGMQFAEYDKSSGELRVVRNESAPVDRESVIERANHLRDVFNLHEYAGETLEIHPSGMLTFPILGTKANIADKLAYDPDRSKRKPMYDTVAEVYSEYTVFLGGSSSFDIVPKPYCKSHALLEYLKNHGIPAESAAYCGDDYGPGGNDRDVYLSPVKFITVDDYTKVSDRIMEAGLL